MNTTLHSFKDIFETTFKDGEEEVSLQKIIIPIIQRDYAQGIALIQKEFKLPPLCNFTFRRYLTYGWQVTTGTAEEQEQAFFVSQFMDVYENSFRARR